MAQATTAEAPVGRWVRRKNPWYHGIVRFARKKPLGAVGGISFIILVAMAVFAPLLAPYDPNETHPIDRLTAPGADSKSGNTYLLGTDYLGRDMTSRLVYGSRVSLFVGIWTVVIGITLGTTVGMLSAYIMGAFDLAVQRVIDGLLAFPAIILALVVVATLGPGLINTLIAIAITNWVGTTRIVRGQTLTVKQNVYVEAARAVGAGHTRIILRYILPNIAAPIVILASVYLGSSILFEASLSFLGLGTQPPTPSWGRMLSIEGRVYMEAAPWLAIWPGVIMSIIVLGINFLGDAIRDLWDPRLRGAM